MKKNNIFLIVLASFFTAVFLIGALIVLKLNSDSQKALESENSKDRAAGIPLTPAAMAKYVQVPDSENANPIYQQIFKEWKPQYETESELRAKVISQLKKKGITGSDFSKQLQLETSKSKIEQTNWAENSKPLALLPEALKARYFVAPKKWSDGYAILLPEFADLNSIVSVLLAKGKLAMKSDPSQSIKDMKSIVQMGNQLRTNPTLIGLLVQLRMCENAMVLGDSIIEQNPLNGGIATEVMNVAKSIQIPSGAHSPVGEAYMGNYTLLHAKPSDLRYIYTQNQLTEPLWIHFSWMRQTVTSHLNRYNRLQLNAIVTGGNNFPVIQKNLAKVQIVTHRGRSRFNMFAHSMNAPEKFIFKMQKYQRTLITACQIELYHLVNHHSPTSIQQFGTASINPLNQKQLKYAVIPNGFQLDERSPAHQRAPMKSPIFNRPNLGLIIVKYPT